MRIPILFAVCAIALFQAPTALGREGTINIRLTTGEIIQVRDFRHDPDVFNIKRVPPDKTRGPYNYFLACRPSSSKSCPYTIFYEVGIYADRMPEVGARYPNSFGLFSVEISNPLAKNRIEAEQYLMKKLGLSQDQLCQLQYRVAENDSREDLKFSFCPGAVALK
jgi:hypothetical protein